MLICIFESIGKYIVYFHQKPSFYIFWPNGSDKEWHHTAAHFQLQFATECQHRQSAITLHRAVMKKTSAAESERQRAVNKYRVMYNHCIKDLLNSIG